MQSKIGLFLYVVPSLNEAKQEMSLL